MGEHERPDQKPWTLERGLSDLAVREETQGKGGVEIHAGGYCLGVWVDHEYDGHSPRMGRMLRRANHYPEVRRVLQEFVTDVEAVSVERVAEEWPDLATTYHHAKRVLAEEQGDSHA